MIAAQRRPSDPLTEADVIAGFEAALRERGIIPPRHIIGDGKLHRCDAEGRGGKSDAAYLLFLDGVPAGGFQNWRDAEGWQNWTANVGRQLTAAERDALRQKAELVRAEREADKTRRQAEAAAKAAEILLSAEPCTSHPYLANKGVQPYGLRISRDKIVVPVRDAAGTLHSLQFIDAEGGKRFLSGGRVSGCYFAIGTPGDVLLVGEGYATCASAHEATGYPAAVAFDAGNLRRVAETLRAKFPETRIVILADDDFLTVGNPGLAKAKAAAAVINAVVAIPKFDAHRPENAVDFNDMAQISGADAVCDCIEAALAAGATASDAPEPPDAKPEPPRPLMRELPPADTFPVDALGDVLGAAALAIHDRVQSPIAIGAQSVLAAATLAVQAYADIELPIGQGSRRPLSGYFLTIAASGERKSQCDREALWPIEKYEETLRADYGRDLPSHTNAKLAWEKARDTVIRQGKGNSTAIANALDAIGPEPSAPLYPMLTAPEPTFEGLAKLFSISRPSLGIFSSEGGSFIGGHGMSQESKLRTAAGLSDVWDGKPIRRVRGGDGAIILPGRRLSLHLMAQPGVADILFNDSLLTEQGLLSRALVTAPDTAAGTRFWREESSETDRAIRRYGARLLSILETPLPLRPDTTNELSPRRIVMSPEARTRWIAYSEHIERELKPNGELESIRGLANKLPEHAARLAAVLALVRNIEAGEVTAADITAGIALAEHYSAEARRLFGVAQISQDLRHAQNLLNWLLGSWSETAVSLPSIYQKGPRTGAKDKATAAKLVAILEGHGWLIKIPGGAAVDGMHRRDAWQIIRG